MSSAANAFNMEKSRYLPYGTRLNLSQTIPCFSRVCSTTAVQLFCLQYTSFENTMGQGEIAHNEQFLLSPWCFLLFRRTHSHFFH